MARQPRIITAYLRDGRVHEDREAYEGGDGLADYRYEMKPRGHSQITTVINGCRYRSLWAWRPDSKIQHGYVSLIEEKS